MRRRFWVIFWVFIFFAMYFGIHIGVIHIGLDKEIQHDEGIQHDKGTQLVRNAKENRIALIIGNTNYEYDKLQNTLNDADDMAEILKRFGFEVILKKDCKLEEMEKAITEFIQKLDKESVALFYYSGHGAQIGGSNYLIPINNTIKYEAEVRHKTISANVLLDIMEQQEPLINIVILDACRNNPFGKSFRTKSKTVLNQGLAEMRANGSIVVYATGAGAVASDNQGERNGLFTKYLLKHIPSGEGILDTLTKVNKDVYRESKKEQSPFLYSGLRENFYFSKVSGVKPQNVDINMDDLKRWNEYGKKMKATFDEIQASAMQKEIKKEAWERFLRSFSQDNPYSQEDERMRTQAQKGIEQCEKEMTKKGLEFEIKEVNTQNSHKQMKKKFDVGETVYVSLKWFVKRLEGGEKEEVEIQGEGIPLYSQIIRDQSEEGEWTVELPLSIQRIGNYYARVNLKIGSMQKQSPVWFEIKAKPKLPQAQYKTSQDGRYRMLSSGIIQDTKTNLEWLVGPDKDMYWDEAKAWVESVAATQYGAGWRMPTTEELPTIYEKGKGKCNIDSVFVSPKDYLYVWSGELIPGSLSACYFNFHNGYENSSVRSYRLAHRVFAVRSGRQ